MRAIAKLSAKVYRLLDIHNGGKDDGGLGKAVEMIVKLALGVTRMDKVTRNNRKGDFQFHGILYEVKTNGGAIGIRTAKGDDFSKVTACDRIIYFPNITVDIVNDICDREAWNDIFTYEHYILETDIFINALVYVGLIKYNARGNMLNIQKFSQSVKKSNRVTEIYKAYTIERATL